MSRIKSDESGQDQVEHSSGKICQEAHAPLGEQKVVQKHCQFKGLNWGGKTAQEVMLGMGLWLNNTHSEELSEKKQNMEE